MDYAKYKISKSKLDELSTELATLETQGRKEIADSLDWLRGQPNDLEDVTFSDVLDDKNFLEKRIAELKEIISNAIILDKSSVSDQVDLGTTVTVGFEGYEDSFTIVSALEADPVSKKISNESPVGKALLGAKIGDTVNVQIGSISKKFRILKIK